MTLTVNLESDLVKAIRSLADSTGQDLDHTIAGLLRDQIGQRPLPESCCSPAETQLLRQIQEGLPAATWRRYRELVARRESEQLTDVEQPELVTLADMVEGWNLRRLELAADLASLRGVSWQTVVEELGLTSPSTHS